MQPQRAVPFGPPAPTQRAAADTDDKRLGVCLLGPLELIGCKKKQPRRQAAADLIAYLALQPNRASRDELLEHSGRATIRAALSAASIKP